MLCKIPPGEVPCHCQYKFSPNCIISRIAYWRWSRQIPPDLVVKFQCLDIVDVILWLVLRPRVVYLRGIKG